MPKMTNSNRWSAMDLHLLGRTRKTAVVLGIVLAIPVTTYFGANAGAGWAAGIVWSLVNLYFLTELIKMVITTDQRPWPRILLIMLVKFPLLYGVGLLLMMKLPAAWLVAGFTWPFFVIVMKGAGRVYMRLDEKTLPGSSS